MSKSRRSVVPYQSNWGTVNPGDEVYVVTKCTGNVKIQKGTYVGISKSGGVQVRVDIFRRTPYYVGTDIKVDWSQVYTMTLRPKTEYRRELCARITTLVNNNILPLKGH